MTRTITPVNQAGRSRRFGSDHAQLRPAPAQILTVAGQGSVAEDGRLMHEDDVFAQLALAMSNVEAVLAAAGMDLGDVLRMTIYAVDVDAVLRSGTAIGERLAACGASPPTTLVGVTRLAVPGMAVEIDVTAGR